MIRLQNDTAFAMATHLLEIVQNCIRPEEYREAWEEFYRVCVAGLQTYEQTVQRQEQRVTPSRN